AFIRRKNVGYEPKKSKAFSRCHFEKFIIEADDKDNLLLKVALIIGIGGACRKIEVLKLTTDNVTDDGDHLTIDIEDTKTHSPRQFIITPGSVNGVDLLEILRRYIALRPLSAKNDRFFLGYRAGKCVCQPVGINTFASMPSKIATLLGLNDPKKYTGHCFRRSSATILAEGRASLTTIQQLGGWKSSKLRESVSGESSSLAAAEIFGNSINESSLLDSLLESDMDLLLDANVGIMLENELCGVNSVQTFTSSQITSSKEMSMSVVKQ
ncbi:hypothetical protein Bhyg_03554, partial [Pseudolycoriella hygida]